MDRVRVDLGGWVGGDVPSFLGPSHDGTDPLCDLYGCWWYGEPQGIPEGQEVLAGDHVDWHFSDVGVHMVFEASFPVLTAAASLTPSGSERLDVCFGCLPEGWGSLGSQGAAFLEVLHVGECPSAGFGECDFGVATEADVGVFSVDADPLGERDRQPVWVCGRFDEDA